MTKILVTGANGQLGKCLQDAAASTTDMSFDFVAREQLDISDKKAVEEYFNSNDFEYCINTAAYTNVEKAEEETKKAFKINGKGAKNIADACEKKGVTLIHVSTDYVFDGTKKEPYVETDTTNPLNVYGASKLKGEHHIQETFDNYFIVRTSWLYSEYGHNFYNSMVKFARQGKPLTITTEQTGTPTNANDLARALIHIVASKSKEYGVYHFSNTGKATWYDFAEEILNKHPQLDTSKLAKTDHYPTFAKRPTYSILDTHKFEKQLGVKPINWKESLKTVIVKSLALH